MLSLVEAFMGFFSRINTQARPHPNPTDPTPIPDPTRLRPLFLRSRVSTPRADISHGTRGQRTTGTRTYVDHVSLLKLN